jgi:hypothetical protein
VVEKITSIDMLTEMHVNIKRQKYIEHQGQHLSVGDPHWKTYMNATHDRDVLAAEVPEPYLSAVMAVWGNEPMIHVGPAAE